VLAGIVIGAVAGFVLVAVTAYFAMRAPCTCLQPSPPVSYLDDGKWPVNRAQEKGYDASAVQEDAIPPPSLQF
jgi:hypothetical protein